MTNQERLAQLDAEIEALEANLAQANADVKTAQAAVAEAWATVHAAEAALTAPRAMHKNLRMNMGEQ